MSDTANSSVKSATRTLDIIEYVVAAGRPLVAQEVSTALAIPVSSLSYLLATLVERDYLLRDGRRYRPGPGLARLQAHSGALSLADRVAPLVRTLRVQLNETTSFFIRHGWEVEAIVTESSDQALRYAIDTGRRMPMHALASGKVLLAAMDDEELDRYFQQAKMERFTPATVTTEARLRRQLTDIRTSHFAQTDEELSLGIFGIGRAVRIDGRVAGALSVAIPKVRYSPELVTRTQELLAKTAGILEAE